MSLPLPPPRPDNAWDTPATDAAAGSPHAEESSLADWLRLAHTPGIGPVRGQQLLRQLGPPAAIFRTPATRLHSLLGQPRLACALLADNASGRQAVDAALDWLCQPGRFILTLDDPRYPASLLHLADPPLLLYAEGSLSALDDPGLAIVGSRRATHDGLANAFHFAEALARRQIMVASGLAEGIDRAAHQGALAGRQDGHPATLAVLGSGVDRIYPPHHRRLASQIIESGGLLLSEQPLGSAPLKANFPRRNRMIAALSRGVLVVEAALQSGSLITARLAAEIGREVMAIPGSIHNPQSRGCHHLLRQGAGLVECIDDVLDCLGLLPAASTAAAETNRPPPDTGRAAKSAATPASSIGPQAEALLALLADHPQSTEALSTRLGWPIGQTLVLVQRLELAGLLGRHIDGRWQRQSPAA